MTSSKSHPQISSTVRAPYGGACVTLPRNISRKKRMRKIQRNAKRKIPAGKYLAEILSVCDSPKHEENEAFVIRYRMSDSAGNSYSYEETFFYSERNARTRAFNDYLDRHNIGYYDELVGKRERVKIGRSESSWGALLPTITERAFIQDDE